MIPASFKQVNTGYTLTFPVQKAYTLKKLRLLWAEQSKIDHDWFSFTDARGIPIPEDGFVGELSLTKKGGKKRGIRRSRLKIFVEELRPIKIHIEGFPHLSQSFPITLSTHVWRLKEEICEELVLPNREMLLLFSNGPMEESNPISFYGILEGSEITVDFLYTIQINEIGISGVTRTVRCFASDSVSILLNNDQDHNRQRLFLNDTILTHDPSSRICDVLRNVGGLYWPEWDLQLDHQILITIIYPRWCEKVEKCTTSRNVWLLDALRSLFYRECKAGTLFLYNGIILPPHYTFERARVVNGSKIEIGIFLRLTIRDLCGKFHNITISNTDSLKELRTVLQKLERKRLFHIIFQDSILGPERSLLKSFSLKDDSLLKLSSVKVKYILTYNDKQYDIGSMDEHASFEMIYNECNKIVQLSFNSYSYFECQCGQTIENVAEREVHNYLCCDIPRNIKVVQQIKLIFSDEARTVSEMIMPISKKLWELSNLLTDDYTVSLLLTHDDNILDKNKTLYELFGDSTEVRLNVRSIITPSHQKSLTTDISMKPIITGCIQRINTNNTRKNWSECNDYGAAEANIDTENPRMRKFARGIKRLCERDRQKTKSFYSSTSESSVLTQEDDCDALKNLMIEVLHEGESEITVEMSSQTSYSSSSSVDLFSSKSSRQKKKVVKIGNISTSEKFKRSASSDENYLSCGSSNQDIRSGSSGCADDDESDLTSLLSAIESGNKEKTEEILAFQSCINEANAKGITALHVASFYNYVELMNILIRNGSDIEARENSGATPLLIATGEGKREAVKCLLRNLADIEAVMNDGTSVLIMAIKEGHIEIVDMLLAAGADVEKKSSSGITPLFKAVQMNNFDMVVKLLEYKADPNTKLTSGTTALFRAVQNNMIDLVEILLNAGARISDHLENGANVLHYSCRMNDIRMTNLLINRGANVNSIGSTCDSPLHIAVKHDLTEIAELLIKAGANVNSTWFDGSTPLHTACYNKRWKLAELLIKNGAEVDMAKHDGTTPLMISVREMDVKMAKLLLENGANIRHCTMESAANIPIEENEKLSSEIQQLLKSYSHKITDDPKCLIQ